jgi:hypothetical protein
MQQFGGKDLKRHFTVVMGEKEHGLYVSSTPSSAAKKAVTKLCTANKSKKVEFYIREITQGSKKKTYGPYLGYIEKLKEPIELKGRVIKYKPVAKLKGKTGAKKGGNGSDAYVAQNFYTFNNLSNIPLGINNAPYPEPSNREIQKKEREEHKKFLQDYVKTTSEDKKIIKQLIDIAYDLKQKGLISSYSYSKHSTEHHPVYIAINIRRDLNSLPQYFLTFIQGYYIAFYVEKPETDKTGEVFLPPYRLKDFHIFKDSLQNFYHYQERTFFNETCNENYCYYSDFEQWASLLTKQNLNNMDYRGIYILVKLGRYYSWQNKSKVITVYPTYKIKKIKTFANHEEKSYRLDRET